MLSNKNISRFVVILTVIASCFCIIAAVLYPVGETKAADPKMEYEKKLFDPSGIISVNIIMPEDEWADMLDKAIEEKYYKCDAEVNGELFHNVAIRPSGNSSLSLIYNDSTVNRYSLKLEFDRYVKGQTCFGLDKLILHNNYCDPTNMKEPFVFDMYRFIGADAPLCNYAKISVNNAYWGIYTAFEAVEDSFLLRTYGTKAGTLYKPDNMDLRAMGDNLMDLDFSKLNFESLDLSRFGIDASDLQDVGLSSMSLVEMREKFADLDRSDFSLENLNFDGFGEMVGAMMGSGGADLEYVDDDLKSYPAIWNGAVTASNSAGQRRVVRALRNISEGSLEEAMDIDNVLKYMAVHTFSANSDSLSGSWAHNYYLYEQDGKLNIIPWDYNLCFGGGTTGSDASEVVNSPIDHSFHATTFFDRLFDDPKYMERYHSYLNMLCEEYVENGRFDAFYSRSRALIDNLSESDPSAFFSGEAYHEGADAFYDLVMLRSESVLGQVKGSIPSTESGQLLDSVNLVDASGIDMTSLGSNVSAGFDFGRWIPQGMSSGNGGFNLSSLRNMDTNSNSFIGQFVRMIKNAFSYVVCLIVMVIALIVVVKYRRKPIR